MIRSRGFTVSVRRSAPISHSPQAAPVGVDVASDDWRQHQGVLALIRSSSRGCDRRRGEDEWCQRGRQCREAVKVTPDQFVLAVPPPSVAIGKNNSCRRPCTSELLIFGSPRRLKEGVVVPRSRGGRAAPAFRQCGVAERSTASRHGARGSACPRRSRHAPTSLAAALQRIDRSRRRFAAAFRLADPRQAAAPA